MSDQIPQAVAAATPQASAPTLIRGAETSGQPTPLADAAGERGNISDDGWQLTSRLDWSSDCGAWTEYFATRGGVTKHLGVSRFHFHPTQERFAWLVRAGFPGMIRRAGGTYTPICDDDIDAAITAEQVAA